MYSDYIYHIDYESHTKLVNKFCKKYFYIKNLYPKYTIFDLYDEQFKNYCYENKYQYKFVISAVISFNMFIFVFFTHNKLFPIIPF